jgi:mannose-1-phosphate guanylyltransferase
MKAMVFTAGYGTRLRPLTLETAKPAIPVLGIPLIARTLQKLASSGITHSRLNLHFLPDTIKQALESFKFDLLQISYSYEPQILGTGGGLKSNESFFDSKNFLTVNGDIFFDFSIEPIIDFHIKNRAMATLALYPQKHPYQYTPITIDSHYRIRSFPRSRLIKNDTGNSYVFTGIAVLSKDIFGLIKPDGYSDIISEAYENAIAFDQKIMGFPVNGYWNDLGTPSRYLCTQKTLFERYHWDPSIFVANNAVLGEDVELGPYVSVGSECLIGDHCRIQDSILWDNCHVGSGSTLRRCILGKGVSVHGYYHDRIITAAHGESSID